MHHDHEGAGVSQRGEVLDVESVHALVCRCSCECPEDAAKSAVLGDGTDAEAGSGVERTVERMTGLAGEQRKGVVAVESEQRTAQVPRVGRVALALTLAAVRINAEVHGGPSTILSGGNSRRRSAPAARLPQSRIHYTHCPVRFLIGISPLS